MTKKDREFIRTIGEISKRHIIKMAAAAEPVLWDENRRGYEGWVKARLQAIEKATRSHEALFKAILEE